MKENLKGSETTKAKSFIITGAGKGPFGEYMKTSLRGHQASLFKTKSPSGMI